MTERRIVVAILVLAGLLGFQLASNALRERRIAQILSKPIEVGQTLRGSWYLLDGRPFSPPDGCWHGYFSSPSCSWCRKLAEDWIETDSRAPVFWLFSESRNEITAFAQEYGLPTDSVLVLEPGSTIPDVGVFGTPTQVSLNHRTVVWIQAPQGVLTSAQAQSICLANR